MADESEDERALAVLQITDDDLVESAPRVRALQIARLEAMWKPVKVRLQQDETGAMPIDPRLLEIGLRIVKEESLLYRLYKPPVASTEEADELPAGFDRAAELERQLVEIEQRRASQGHDGGGSGVER